MGNYELEICAGKGKGESGPVSATCAIVARLLLVDARQQDEPIHEQQTKTAPADPED